jgi:sec-independent protein translocase protein TatA
MGLDNPIHIAVLLMVVLLVFGARRLPEIGHSLGSGLRGFKDSLSGEAPPSALSAAPQAESPTAPPVPSLASVDASARRPPETAG